MTADDLIAAFDTLPAPWAAVLPGWTAARRAAVVQAVRAVSGSLPIAPADPFRALRLVAPAAVRVVILGQDPYPTEGHADGLASRPIARAGRRRRAPGSTAGRARGHCCSTRFSPWNSAVPAATRIVVGRHSLPI
jgi:hypothetical protein